MLPPNQTNKVHPIDQGEGYLMKKENWRLFRRMTEDDENLKKGTKKNSKPEKGGFFSTKMGLGQAWQELTDNYSDVRR